MDAPKKVGAGVLTRRDFECPIFGHPRELLSNKLPTHEDILRCCFQERFNLAIEANNKRVSFSKVAVTVGNKVKCLYDKASIPTVTEYRVVQIINTYYDSYCNVRKSYNRDKDKPTLKKKCTILRRMLSPFLTSQPVSVLLLLMSVIARDL